MKRMKHTDNYTGEVGSARSLGTDSVRAPVKKLNVNINDRLPVRIDFSIPEQLAQSMKSGFLKKKLKKIELNLP